MIIAIVGLAVVLCLVNVANQLGGIRDQLVVIAIRLGAVERKSQ